MTINFFDWDDTIAMTRKALFLSYKKVIQEELDFVIDFNYFNEHIYNNSNLYFKQFFKLEEDKIKEIKDKKEHYYLELFFNEIKFNWPIFKENNKYYIVSNTNAKLIRTIINKYDCFYKTNYLPKFEIIGTDYKLKKLRRKPEIDLYETAFKTWVCKMNENDILEIYEDSIEGLIASVNFISKYRKKIPNFKINHITEFCAY